MKKETKPQPLLCMGLARLIGFLSFLVIGIPLGYLLSWMNNLHIGNVMDIINLGKPAYINWGVAIFIGGIAWEIGQDLGSKIKIRDDDFASELNYYWHYITSGTFIWLVSSIVIIGVAFEDKDAQSVFYSTEGKNFFNVAIFFGALAGIFIPTFIGLGRGTKYQIFWDHIMPLITIFALGLMQFRAVYEDDLPSAPVTMIAFGVIFPYVIRFYSDYMYKKDMRKRGEISF